MINVNEASSRLNDNLEVFKTQLLCFEDTSEKQEKIMWAGKIRIEMTELKNQTIQIMVAIENLALY
jgi:hypothetical protein